MKDFPLGLQVVSGALYSLETRFFFDSPSKQEFLEWFGAEVHPEGLEKSADKEGFDIINHCSDCFAEMLRSFISIDQRSSSDEVSFLRESSPTEVSKEQEPEAGGMAQSNLRSAEGALFNFFKQQITSMLYDGSGPFASSLANNNGTDSLDFFFSEPDSLKSSEASGSLLNEASQFKHFRFVTSLNEHTQASDYSTELGWYHPQKNGPADIFSVNRKNQFSSEPIEYAVFNNLTYDNITNREDLLKTSRRMESPAALTATFQDQLGRNENIRNQSSEIKLEGVNLVDMSWTNSRIISLQRNSQSENTHLTGFQSGIASFDGESVSNQLFEDSFGNGADNFQRSQNQSPDSFTESSIFGPFYEKAISDVNANSLESPATQGQTSFIQLLKDRLVDLAQSNQGRLFVSLEIFDEPLSLVILSNKGELKLNFRTKSSTVESKLVGISGSLQAYLKSKGFTVSEFIVNDINPFGPKEKISLSSVDHFLQELEV